MRERVRLLREASMEAEPAVSQERALLVTEAYRRHEGRLTPPLLRARVFEHLMEEKDIYIGADELIVGERGPRPAATPTYPELCCHSIEDLRLIDGRPKIPFRVDSETLAIQRDRIIPFWRNKSMRDQIFAGASEEWRDCYEAGIFTEFMEQRAPGHTVADDKIYRRGMSDLMRDIQAREKALQKDDPTYKEKRDQLRAMAICARALVTYARRHSARARELAAAESDPTRRAELRRIAEITHRVPAQPPRDFWEALQAYWFVHLGVITELNTWDSFSPGRLDQHLYPFYRDDLQAGRLTSEDARELLGCFWVKFNNQPAPPKVGVTLKESGTYADFANISIGGMTPDGFDGVNPLSYLLLELIREMRLVQPSGNVQVSERNPDRFVEAAARVIREGMGQPSAFNADAVMAELLRQGKRIEDARAGGTSGCVETGAFGKEAYILTGYFNLPKILEITLNGGLDPRTGRRIGLPGQKPDTFKSMDDLLAAYRSQIQHFVEVKMRGNDKIERLFARDMPSPFLSLVIDDCIEQARDYNAGGARYNTRYIQGVGIGTLTDSLSALEHHVFSGRSTTIDRVLESLGEDFAGDEALRANLRNRTPRYGNDDDRADDLMRKAFDIFYESVEGRLSPTGSTYHINMLPTTCHVYFGSVTGATPDGRGAGLPFSEGISPVQGADRLGPTAVLRSAAKMDHLRTGGTLLNKKFNPRLLEGEGLGNLVALIRTYFRMGGHHVQFNVIDAETLRRAQRNPEDYRGLIVRVAGYSDFFNNLDRALQDEIIARTEHGGSP